MKTYADPKHCNCGDASHIRPDNPYTKYASWISGWMPDMKQAKICYDVNFTGTGTLFKREKLLLFDYSRLKSLSIGKRDMSKRKSKHVGIYSGFFYKWIKRTNWNCVSGSRVLVPYAASTDIRYLGRTLSCFIFTPCIWIKMEHDSGLDPQYNVQFRIRNTGWYTDNVPTMFGENSADLVKKILAILRWIFPFSHVSYIRNLGRQSQCYFYVPRVSMTTVPGPVFA